MASYLRAGQVLLKSYCYGAPAPTPAIAGENAKKENTHYESEHQGNGLIKLLFYFGPGNRVTGIIRRLTSGPYSHVEMQFTDGTRFFSSGHGIHTGCHMICDRKLYDEHWDLVLVPATWEQEKAAEKYAFHMIGIPFDFRGMAGFVLPFFGRRRKPRYCSSLVLDVLQQSLRMFPGIGLRISPNGLHRLFLAAHPLVISAGVSETRPVSGTESLTEKMDEPYG
jgi:hypothetical protein